MKRLQDLDRTSLRILLALYSQLPTDYFRRVSREIEVELAVRKACDAGSFPCPAVEGSN
jgi:hypothetical protein